MRNLNTSNQSEVLLVLRLQDYTLSYEYEITDTHTTQYYPAFYCFFETGFFCVALAVLELVL